MKAFLEYWKEVPGYEGIYEVSDYGVVRSLNYGRSGKKKEMKGRKNKKGYEQLNLSRDGIKKNCRVHRLVWEAFNGPIPEGMEIDHINGVKNDNRLVNLRVVTPIENTNNPITRTRHLEANKRLYQDPKWQEANREAIKRRSEDPKWREAHRKACAKPIVQLDKETGALIREWECAKDIERELGIDNSNISKCCRGKQNSAGGFKWQYVDYNYSS